MVRVWGFVIAIFSVLGFAAWASDFITMQGERTIYTVECRDGAWAGDRCAGNLVDRAALPLSRPDTAQRGHLLDGRQRGALGQVRRMQHQGRPQLGLQAERRCAALDHPADGRRRSHRRTR